jgi:hypothetical protein
MNRRSVEFAASVRFRVAGEHCPAQACPVKAELFILHFKTFATVNGPAVRNVTSEFFNLIIDLYNVECTTCRQLILKTRLTERKVGYE